MPAHTFSFYSADLAPGDTEAALDDDEHNHLSRVLRMRPGDHVRVTNGRGLIVRAEIEVVGAKRTTARVVHSDDVPPPAPLALALGMLPREAMDTALTQCIEAGITAWIPVAAQRCHARRGGDRAERWSRIAVSALKQSGRAWLPSIEVPVDASALPAKFALFDRIVLADMDAPRVLDVAAGSAPTLAIVGPEGGFTDAERALFTGAGARAVRISAQRLRAETAAVALVSMLALHRGPV
jgi:16S rRNA (uracil1498-N3)-methyltransferase